MLQGVGEPLAFSNNDTTATRQHVSPFIDPNLHKHTTAVALCYENTDHPKGPCFPLHRVKCVCVHVCVCVCVRVRVCVRVHVCECEVFLTTMLSKCSVSLADP